ncbi:hypothetical protein EVAR_24864_1 [Eumeta japonica]|uniref:Uncharacterized protein n=1 Tax=Eumeta variegata TaxID=151549 RepID=A0A4C1Y8M4_EUMVA|nr:hypothetical protein EVAR_24864_1 [Eumeta japonica]
MTTREVPDRKYCDSDYKATRRNVAARGRRGRAPRASAAYVFINHLSAPGKPSYPITVTPCVIITKPRINHDKSSLSRMQKTSSAQAQEWQRRKLHKAKHCCKQCVRACVRACAYRHARALVVCVCTCDGGAVVDMGGGITNMVSLVLCLYPISEVKLTNVVSCERYSRPIIKFNPRHRNPKSGPILFGASLPADHKARAADWCLCARERWALFKKLRCVPISFIHLIIAAAVSFIKSV